MAHTSGECSSFLSLLPLTTLGLELTTSNAAPPLKFYKMPGLPALPFPKRPKRSECVCKSSIQWRLLTRSKDAGR
jgi:hypothetical protein